MSVLEMNPSKLSPAAQSLYAQISAKRKARGEGFGGPYVALLNHPELARRVEDLGFYLKFEGVLPRPIYQFIVLSVAHATGATLSGTTMCSMHWRPACHRALVDGIAAGKADALPQPYDLVQEILAKTTTWQVVPDELQARAVAQWGREGLVEIVVVSGFYQMFAAINQGFDIHPPA